MKSFASDNWASVHPSVIEAIIRANTDHESAYQQDCYTNKIKNKFKDLFNADVEVFFVTTGTAANVLPLSAMVRYNQGIICADSSHINTDEAGSIERFSGCKLLSVPNYDNGKIRVADMDMYTAEIGNFHRVQPKVVSISNSTERENIYTPNEISEIVDYAKKYNMYVHVDGARCANAVTAINKTMSEVFTDTKIDVLSFGGTKNGMMMGEAVVFFNKDLAKDFLGILKQSMQFISKSRFIAAQFDAILTDNLWEKMARNSNNMAKYLETKIKGIKGVELSAPVITNAVYVKIEKDIVEKVRGKYPFYNWGKDEYRLMCSFDTTEKDIDDFIKIMIDI